MEQAEAVVGSKLESLNGQDTGQAAESLLEALPKFQVNLNLKTPVKLNPGARA